MGSRTLCLPREESRFEYNLTSCFLSNRVLSGTSLHSHELVSPHRYHPATVPGILIRLQPVSHHSALIWLKSCINTIVQLAEYANYP